MTVGSAHVVLCSCAVFRVVTAVELEESALFLQAPTRKGEGGCLGGGQIRSEDLLRVRTKVQSPSLSFQSQQPVKLTFSLFSHTFISLFNAGVDNKSSLGLDTIAKVIHLFKQSLLLPRRIRILNPYLGPCDFRKKDI